MSVTRWPGKPTSGRYVYAARNSAGQRHPSWNWQCDLHDDCAEGDGTYGSAPTMQEAFEAASAHATVCDRTNDREPPVSESTEP